MVWRCLLARALDACASQANRRLSWPKVTITIADKTGFWLTKGQTKKTPRYRKHESCHAPRRIFPPGGCEEEKSSSAPTATAAPKVNTLVCTTRRKLERRTRGEIERGFQEAMWQDQSQDLD